MASQGKLDILREMHSNGDLSAEALSKANLTGEELGYVTATASQVDASGAGRDKNEISQMPWYEKLDKGFEHGLKKTGQGALQGLYHLGSKAQEMAGVKPHSRWIAPALGLPKSSAEMDKYVQQKELEREPYRKHGGGFYTAGDIAGTGVATLPAMMLPGGKVMSARALSGAGAGGGIMATQPVTGDNYAKEKAAQVGSGALLGAGVGVVLPPLIDKAVKALASAGRGVIKTVQGRWGETVAPIDRKLVDDWMREANIEMSHLGVEAKETFYKSVAEQLKAPVPTTEVGRATAEAARRLPYKVDLNKSQITNRFEDVAKESALSKIDYIGKGLRDRKAEQNQALVNNLEYLRGKGLPREAEDIGADYATYTKGRLGQLQKKEVAPAYNKVTEQYGGDFVELPNVMKALREMKDSGADDMSNKVRAVMRKLGDWVENSKDPRAFASTAGQGPQGRLNVRMAEQYRKKINEYAEEALPAEKNDIMTMMKALEDDVASAVGRDVYDPARKVAQKRFAERDAYDLPKSKSTADTVKKVKLLREPELRRWADTMRGTREGNRLFQETKGRMLEDIIEKSLNKSQIDELGYPMFDQRQFSMGVEALGKRRREVLFSERENQILDDIILVGRSRVPRKDATNPSGTAQEIMNMIARLASEIPMSGFVSNMVKKVVGGIVRPIGDAAKGNTGKAVDEALHPFKESLKSQSKATNFLDARGLRQGGILTAEELRRGKR